MFVYCLAYSVLLVEMECSSETSIDLERTAWHHTSGWNSRTYAVFFQYADEINPRPESSLRDEAVNTYEETDRCHLSIMQSFYTHTAGTIKFWPACRRHGFPIKTHPCSVTRYNECSVIGTGARGSIRGWICC